MISKCWQFWEVLAVLAAASLACSSPGWVPAPEPGRATETAIPSPVPSQEAEKPEPARAAPEPGRGVGTVSAMQSLNVREDSKYSSPGVGVLYHGARVFLTGRCSGIWAEIVFEGSKRWVNGRYITGDKCEVGE